jgi:hypothetical protein
MSYVGTGCGDYIQETTYKYVGAGAGEFEVVASKQKSIGIFVGVGVGLIVLVLVIVLLMIPKPPTTTTTTTSECATTMQSVIDGWSPAQKAFCCKTANKGCVAPPKICTLWGDPHIIAFDQQNQDKHMASSFYGDGDFWIVKATTISIQGRFLGTRYTEGLAATNQIAVSGSFIAGHKIEVGTRESGIVTVDGQAVAFSTSYRATDGSFTVSYNNQGEVPDVVPEGNEKRVVTMTLPLGIVVKVFQWSNYVDVTISMAPQPGQDGVCGNFNGNQGDDTTQAIFSRLGARVAAGKSILSGTPTIEYTPQMDKMVKAECTSTKLTTGRSKCQSFGLSGNTFNSCLFDECFGMIVNARSHAKTYA